MAGQIRCFLSELTRHSGASRFDTHNGTDWNHILGVTFFQFYIRIYRVHSTFPLRQRGFQCHSNSLSCRIWANKQRLLDRRLSYRSSLHDATMSTSPVGYDSHRSNFLLIPNGGLCRFKKWFTDLKLRNNSFPRGSPSRLRKVLLLTLWPPSFPIAWRRCTHHLVLFLWVWCPWLRRIWRPLDSACWWSLIPRESVICKYLQRDGSGFLNIPVLYFNRSISPSVIVRC